MADLADVRVDTGDDAAAAAAADKDAPSSAAAPAGAGASEGDAGSSQGDPFDRDGYVHDGSRGRLLAGGNDGQSGVRGGATVDTPSFMRNRPALCLLAALVLVVLLIIMGFLLGGNSTVGDVSVDALRACVQEHVPRPPLEGRGNARLDEGSPEWLVVRHCEAWTGELPPTPTSAAFDDSRYIKPDHDVLMKDGVIQNIAPTGITVPAGTVEVSAGGRPCTPGIVDMHSHAGVYGWPEVWAREDGNEMTEPTYPQVRAIDAFDPEDEAIPQILGGGITTSQILPGSGNVMGGEGFIAKMRGSSVGDYYVPGSPRLLKMACGENPKRVYGESGHIGTTPMSRMGSAWLMRQKFEAAAKLIRSQETWCADPGAQLEFSSLSAAAAAESGDDGAHHEADHAGITYDPSSDHGHFPSDLSLDSLTALLRGDARLHVHCYEVEDLEMVVRLSHEFNFSVSAFHHGLEAYKIPSVMLENGITVATFSDLWGYKMEAYDASVRGPKILNEAGVPVALKSDHPVINAHDLVMEAAKSRYYGLERFAAMAAVTSVPAEAIGMGGRVGRLEIGWHADMVIWDRDPLTLGATPLHVYVNGELLVDRGLHEPMDTSLPTSANPPGHGVHSSVENGGYACSASSQAYAVVGATVLLSGRSGRGTTENAVVVVENGIITCIRPMTDEPGCNIPEGADVYRLEGGTIVPGMVETLSHVGQLDIEAEGSTQDGVIGGSGSDGSLAGVKAVDGIRMNSRHVRSAWLAGVTTSVTHPMGSQLVSGLGVAYHTFYADGTIIDDVLLADDAGLHVNVGNRAKNGGITDSVSGQMSALRGLFGRVNASLAAAAAAGEPAPALSAADAAVAAALTRHIPLVAHANQADVIAAVLRLRQEFGFRLVIAGAAEAHVLAGRIKEAGDDVSVLTARIPAHDFATMRADSVQAIVHLVDAGIRVGISANDPGLARNLRWEAGLAYQAGVSHDEALRLTSRNIAEMFGMEDRGLGRVSVGDEANFVAYDGEPLSLQAAPHFIALRKAVECHPQQL